MIFNFTRVALLLGVAFSLGGTAFAGAAESDETSDQEAAFPARPWHFRFGGYGDLRFSFHDYGPDQNRQGGSQKDSRLVFDTTRLVLKAEGELPAEVEVEAEIEIEHGGTGAAFDVAYEEFGEFEKEVEKGGEVLVEELYVKKELGGWLELAAGRFYVAVGRLFDHHLPTDYAAATRAESESTMLPAVWHEMGVQAEAELGPATLTLQVVNGLDSTGFSSQRWVASGHQGRFETIRASNLAVVGRVDLEPLPELDVGVSAYWGGTSRNRPKADLVSSCAPAPDEVAPCGYLAANVFITDVHGGFQVGPVRGSAVLLWGHLSNAEAISNRNARLSNELDVLRTPVATAALATWGELDLDTAPWLGLGRQHRLEAFGRLEYVDTMFSVATDVFDNPRFARTVVGGGAAYTYQRAVFGKLDVQRRTFGSSALRPELTIALATGFVF